MISWERGTHIFIFVYISVYGPHILFLVFTIQKEKCWKKDSIIFSFFEKCMLKNQPVWYGLYLNIFVKYEWISQCSNERVWEWLWDSLCFGKHFVVSFDLKLTKLSWTKMYFYDRLLRLKFMRFYTGKFSYQNYRFFLKRVLRG